MILINTNEKAIDELLKGVDLIFDKKIKRANFSKEEKAIILTLNSNTTCNILMNGIQYSNIPYKGITPTANEIVVVNIPNNNYNNMYVSMYNNNTSGGGGGTSENGATFTPAITTSKTDGTTTVTNSWTNDKGLANPTNVSYDIQDGESGVYVGSEEPVDDNIVVWINTDETGIEYATKEYVDTAITGALGGSY